MLEQGGSSGSSPLDVTQRQLVPVARHFTSPSVLCSLLPAPFGSVSVTFTWRVFDLIRALSIFLLCPAQRWHRFTCNALCLFKKKRCFCVANVGAHSCVMPIRRRLVSVVKVSGLWYDLQRDSFLRIGSNLHSTLFCEADREHSCASRGGDLMIKAFPWAGV